MTDKQIIIDGVDVNSLYHDQITCMNRYEVATLFIKTVELLVAKEQECETLASQLDFEVQKKECLEQECEELKDLNTRLDNQRETYWKEYQKLKRQHQADKGLITSTGKMNYQLLQEYDKLKTENEELRQILWNVDFNRQSKGKKLIRIEELLKKCATGYTDEFIQEMFSILYELEPVCRYNKLEQLSKTLTEIKEIAQYDVYATRTDLCLKLNWIKKKISEVEDGI